jgi:hypothetical protein
MSWRTSVALCCWVCTGFGLRPQAGKGDRCMHHVVAPS